MSADGSVVAGYFSTYINPKDRPFRWTAGTGTVALQLPPGAVRGIARGISADGQFIVGDVVT
ncbi:MAG: PEP-CTERM sorting domain-containing protein, partial [Phycisphaerales bacterium]